MFIFNSYVASFTSKYSDKISYKKLVEKASVSGFSLLENREEGKLILKDEKRFFSPVLSVNISEKVDGALVYVRMDASKGKKVFSAFMTLFLTLIFAFSVTMCVLWGVHFMVSVATFFSSCLFIHFFERFWAKKGCIKTYKKLGAILDYTPPVVTIIKVKKA